MLPPRLMEIEDEIFLAASQMYEEEEQLRAKYGFMGEDDFTLDRLLADIDVASSGALQEYWPKRKQMPLPEIAVVLRYQRNLLLQSVKKTFLRK